MSDSLPPAPTARPGLLARWPALASFALALRDARAAVFDAPIEPILHPSRWRLRWIGLFTLLGHPLFGWVWGHWLPQAWEHMGLRLAAALLGLPLLFDLWKIDLASRRTHLLFNGICWLQLPVLFSWMYLCNSGSTVWLSSMVAMVLIYYHVTDWRLATLGIASGALLAACCSWSWGLRWRRSMPCKPRSMRW